MRSLLIALFLPVAAWADGDRAGVFDYYVMALSWSPNWCEREGGGSPQCAPERDLGWILHGLWPQHEVGWPRDCHTNARNPSRADTAAMADIMGTSGLARHQWNKHGRCSGLSSNDYFALSREAYGRVERPDVFRRLGDTVKLPARVVEEAFLEANPALSADMLTVTCKNRQIQEVRICLTRDLAPRRCGRDVRRDCTQSDALFHPIP
ncbi:MAG: ribonuclease T2 [Pseudomonadota bacterium]